MELPYYDYKLASNNDLDIINAFTQQNHLDMGKLIFNFKNNCIEEEKLEEIEPQRSQNLTSR